MSRERGSGVDGPRSVRPAPLTKWQEKNVGVLSKRGTSVRKPVTDERDGSRAGYHIEHWDDHQDAVATPRPIKLKVAADLKEANE